MTDLNNASNSTTNRASEATRKSRVSKTVPNNCDLNRQMKEKKRKELKRKIFMPNKKAQQEIERQLCKDSKYATYVELTLDVNRKLIMKEIKNRGCYDEVADNKKKVAL